MRGKHPPKKLQGVLWSCSVEKLDLEKDKAYIINQVLMFGGFEELRWLLSVYPKKTIRNVFINNPLKVYTRSGFNFIKNFVLGLKDLKLSPRNYVNTFYGRP
jgi:hypothetical protein